MWGGGLPAVAAASCISLSRADRSERAAMAIPATRAACPMPFEAPLKKMYLPPRSSLVGSMAGYVSCLRVDVKL